MSDLFQLYDLATARDGILRRKPINDIEVTPAMKERARDIFGEPLTPPQAVARIIADVRERGDNALREWTQLLDGVALDKLAVTPEEIAAAVSSTPTDDMAALKLAAQRIEAFHRRQPLISWMQPSAEGLLGQLVLPIERVGVYVPGGTAPLPSTLLMCAIPAQVAGVTDIIATTPPGPDGTVPSIILAAAHVAGIDTVYKLGGAQAIAALAYGTAGVPKVDKIVGPGNLFVTLAKQQVYGAVGIDGLLGPTETVVIADEHADPALVAADLLAQAEHDVLASAILITPSRPLAEQVAAQIGQQIETLSRSDFAAESLTRRGGAVIVDSLEQAFAVANTYAPEHFQLSVREPSAWLGYVRNAGAVFLGEYSFEVLGDYVAGPSHSLPTSGTARFASGLNAADFVKITPVIGLNADAAAELSATADTIARAEGLTAHAAAARARRRE
ncbi:MAG: histidinol dehydrogenase [Anaerolineae bacterium]|nr:histidinol dehydrogenase [Anaerolineae bacterium]